MNKISTASFLLVISTLFVLFSASAASAQTTAFTYQGRLTDNAASANGQYDLQFRLTDSAGTTVAGTNPLQLDDVLVSNGIFAVELDFGASAFDGNERFLEIGVRPGVSTGAFTILSPRQRLTSSPYAIKSQNGGADGFSTLAATAAEAAGANCATGGVRVQFGLDTNRNSVLDAGEVNATLTRFICNGAQGAQGAQGIQGPAGPQGPAGTLGAYGDGSAGSLVVGAGATVDLSAPAVFNTQFSSILIASGGTLIAPSGTVLRATGNVTINGTVTVQPGAADSGGFRPNPGISLAAAGNPSGGIGLTQYQAAQIIPKSLGGGAGGHATTVSGGEGGGAIMIRAQGSITMGSGSLIQANGNNGLATTTGTAAVGGGGGGAGGIIVLMSRAGISITSASIRANGGNGGDGYILGSPASSAGGGGGGGGGVIHFFAPNISLTGTVLQANGGAAGNNAIGSNAAATLVAGGGGGAGGGNGGASGSGTASAPVAPGNGSPGYNNIQTIVSAPENFVF